MLLHAASKTPGELRAALDAMRQFDHESVSEFNARFKLRMFHFAAISPVDFTTEAIGYYHGALHALISEKLFEPGQYKTLQEVQKVALLYEAQARKR